MKNNYFLALWNKLKINYKLYALYFFGVIIPVLVIFTAIIFSVQNSLLRQYEEHNNLEILRLKSILLNTTSNTYSYSTKLAFDEDFQSLVSKNYNSYLDFIQNLSNYDEISKIDDESYISNLFIFHKNETIPDNTNFQVVTQDISTTDWYNKAQSEISPFWTAITYKDQFNHTYTELGLVKKIILPFSDDEPVLVFTISNNYLKNNINNKNYPTALSIGGKYFFYSTNSYDFKLNKNYTFQTNSYIDEEKIVSFSRTKLYNVLDNIDIDLYNFKAIDNVNDFMKNFTIVILIFFFVTTLIIFYFTKNLSKRINLLRREIHTASKGDYDIMPTIAGNDEFTEVYDDLIILIDSIKEQEQKIYMNEINKQKLINSQQKAELKMLNQQINPHFFYNTLETIRMKAFMAGNKEIATAIKLLGKYMRYLLDSTIYFEVPLEKELDYLNTYIEIQKIRFKDKINFKTIIDDDFDISDIRILPLLLQPIVENSIQHGFYNIDYPGEITLRITKDLDFIKFEFQDNGLGMANDKVEYFKSMLYTEINEFNNTSESIGLINIIKRLNIYYDKHYKFDIKSNNKGTNIIIQLENFEKEKVNKEEEFEDIISR